MWYKLNQSEVQQTSPSHHLPPTTQPTTIAHATLPQICRKILNRSLPVIVTACVGPTSTFAHYSPNHRPAFLSSMPVGKVAKSLLAFPSHLLHPPNPPLPPLHLHLPPLRLSNRRPSPMSHCHLPHKTCQRSLPHRKPVKAGIRHHLQTFHPVQEVLIVTRFLSQK